MNRFEAKQEVYNKFEKYFTELRQKENKLPKKIYNKEIKALTKLFKLEIKKVNKQYPIKKEIERLQQEG